MAGTSKEAATNGMSIVGKVAIGTSCTVIAAWAIGMSSWAIGVNSWSAKIDGNSWTIQQQGVFQDDIRDHVSAQILQVRQEVSSMRKSLRGELVDLNKVIRDLPPDDWEERIRELEKWRLQELERKRADHNEPANALSVK